MVRAASAGLARITGFDLFLGQAIDAFEIFTGHDLEPQLVTELETSLGILERERGV
jgi:shikimate 5-dehydrogenase